MAWRGGVWPVLPAASLTQTSNSQYGQWFDPTRSTKSSSVMRFANMTSSYQATAKSRYNAFPTESRNVIASPATLSDAMSRDQLASRDQPVTSSHQTTAMSRYDAPATDHSHTSRNVMSRDQLTSRDQPVTSSHQATAMSRYDAPSTDHSHTSRNVMSRDQLTSRDQPVTSSHQATAMSRYDAPSTDHSHASRNVMSRDQLASRDQPVTSSHQATAMSRYDAPSTDHSHASRNVMSRDQLASRDQPVTSSHQATATSRYDAPSTDHSHTSRNVIASPATLSDAMSRDQLGSRDQPVTSSSCVDSSPLTSASSLRTDSREVSWQPVTLPLSLQRSTTTLGVAGRLATSASGVDCLSGQSHADLIRDYRRYRQLQADITGEQSVWRATSRLLTRPTVGAAGQPVSTTTSTSNLQSGIEQPQRRSESETTVTPLQLAATGPLPLQRSVANVLSAPRRLPADVTVGRAHTSRPVSSFANFSSPSDTIDITQQFHSVAQVYFDSK